MLRTVEALVAEAAASTDARSRSLFEEAMHQATTHWEWDLVFAALPPDLDPARRRGIVDRALAVAQAESDAHLVQSVATFCLGDLAEARAVLRRGERSLRGAAGHDLAVLADAWRTLLGDREEAARLIELGWQLAWDALDFEQLGRVANVASRFEPPATTAARVQRLEEAAAAEGQLGRIVYWVNALGEPDDWRRVRQRAVDEAKTFAQLQDVASFWHLYEKHSEGIGPVLAKLQALATDPADWLALGRLAAGEPGHQPLADAATQRGAAALPREARPHALRAKRQALVGFAGDADALFDLLRTTIGTESLHAIAASDYGCDTAAHRAALDRICERGLLLPALPWEPHEVLTLCHWSQGEDVDHTARAFCCTLLALSDLDAEWDHVLAPLVHSALSLGGPVLAAADGFLVWLYETSEPDELEGLMVLVGLALLRARTPEGQALLARIIGSSQLGALRQELARSLRADMWNALLDAQLGGASALNAPA